MEANLVKKLTETIAEKDHQLEILQQRLEAKDAELAALHKLDRRLERRQAAADTVQSLLREKLLLVGQVTKLKEIKADLEPKLLGLERLMSAILQEPEGVELLQRLNVLPPAPHAEVAKSTEPLPELPPEV